MLPVKKLGFVSMHLILILILMTVFALGGILVFGKIYEPSQAPVQTSNVPSSILTETKNPSQKSEAEIVLKTPADTMYYLPEANLQITVPNKYALKNTNGSNLGPSFVRYDFELVEQGLNPKFSAIQFYTDESIKKFANTDDCIHSPALCRNAVDPITKIFNQKEKAFSRLENFNGYSIKSYRGIYYFAKSQKCEGDTCTSHQFITFFGNIMVRIGILSWDIDNFQEIETFFKQITITRKQ